MQTIILGDVHLGKGTALGKSGVGANLNSRVVDQLTLLDWVLDLAIDRSIESIIITGDIFEDPKPPTTLIALFISWLNKCKVHNVDVHIIVGNHDVVRHGSVLSSPLDIIVEIDSPNVSVYKSLDTIFLGSTAFTLVPFRDRKSSGCESNTEAIQVLNDSLVYELAGIPNTYNKVLVGHLAIEGSIPVGDEIDDMTNEIYCPLSMFKGYDYVWMGHVHKPQRMGGKYSKIFHIGSMDISNFLEADQDKRIIVYDCNNSFYIEESLPTRPLGSFSITVPEGTQDSTVFVIDSIKNTKIDINNAIVKVDVVLGEDVETLKKSKIAKYLIRAGAFNVTKISESKKTKLIKRDSNNTLDIQMDVPSAIKSFADLYVDDDKRKEYIEISMDIYEQYKLETKN